MNPNSSCCPWHYWGNLSGRGCASCRTQSCSRGLHRGVCQFDPRDWLWRSLCPERGSDRIKSNYDNYQLLSSRFLNFGRNLDANQSVTPPTLRDTPLPKVTSPDTVRWSSSSMSGILANLWRKSFTYKACSNSFKQWEEK